MCIPAQLSQSNLSVNDKSTILLRALGAFRTLRSHRRIVVDEAAYRALIVACGKCGSDRRLELMKLYSLMRTDGIFPNAVTLGQYTRAIAEGYSRKSGDTQIGMQISTDKPSTRAPFNFDVLDNSLKVLEGKLPITASVAWILCSCCYPSSLYDGQNLVKSGDPRPMPLKFRAIL